MTKKPSKRQKTEQPNLALKYTGIASKMAIIILVGVFGGRKLDEMVSMEFPIFTLILSILSVFSAMYLIIKDS